MPTLDRIIAAGRCAAFDDLGRTGTGRIFRLFRSDCPLDDSKQEKKQLRLNS